MKTIRIMACWVGFAVGCHPSVFAAVYEVSHSADSGAGTLRWAIEAANTNPGLNTITFNLPSPYRIQPTTALPQIGVSDGLVIDGTSQPGSGKGSVLAYFQKCACVAGREGIEPCGDTRLNIE